ncbi:hypothetical protein LSAT2_011692 [Lamellibrachia satsuma]|nr:hypothetical protein LSAT2_011692 [Lamellibrachia satsuma]
MNIRRLVLIVTIVVLQTSDAIAGERCRKVRIRKGRSHMLLRRKMIKYSCKNGFTLVGSRTAICVSGRWSRQPPVCVAPGCPTVIGSWRVRVSHLYDGAVLSFTCGESYALKGKQVIYCNGKTWNSKPPSCTATDAESACDFEQDMCGWTNSNQDQFDWIAGSDETPTVFTGPSWDHTYGDGLKQGFYLYTEMSSPRRPGDSAQLWSPIFPSTYSGKCFQFWYHMFGRAEVGSLSVFMKPIKEKFPGRLPVVIVVGNQGDEWQVQHVTIPPLHEEFQIIIVAERNQSVFSDIAIDDVSVISCPEHIQEPETGSRDTTASASFVTMTSHKDNLPTSVRDISTRKAPITEPTTPTTDTMNTAYTTAPNFRNTANLSTVDTDPTEKGLSAHPDSTAATEETEGTLDATVWSKDEDTSTSHKTKSWGTTETLTSIAVGSVTKHKSGQYDVAAISMPGTQHEQSTTTEVFGDTTARITEDLVHRTTAPPVANMSTNTTMLTRREDLVTDRAGQESEDIATTTHLVTYTVTHRDEIVADNTEQVIDAVSQATQSDELVTYST